MRLSPAPALAFVTFLVCAPAAMAQLQLPGALNGGGPAHEGGTGAPAPPPKPVVIEAPSEDTIAARALSRDGAQGDMTFTKVGTGLDLSKLTLVGTRISNPRETCQVDIALATPLHATASGRPAGALRFAVPLEACPFNIDVLEGAALVTNGGPTCDFAQADCRVSPGGLWGPHAVDITAKQAQDLERDRVRMETTMRANFRALLRKAGKDRVAVKAIAAEQAAFSSEREMMCRDYQDETRHGFCSTQITEARALALLAKFGPVKTARETKASPRHQRPAPADAGEAVDEQPAQ